MQPFVDHFSTRSTNESSKNNDNLFQINSKIKSAKLIHFIGIGGIGMSGIALILHQLGYKIQGSDIIDNYHTQKLKKLGIEFFLHQKASNLVNVSCIVVSSIVSDENPEVIYAKKHNIPIYSKADILQFIATDQYLISVTGTHGKTTTTGLLESIFSTLNLKIKKIKLTCFIGGVLKSINSNAYVNKALKTQGTFYSNVENINTAYSKELNQKSFENINEYNDLQNEYNDLRNNLNLHTLDAALFEADESDDTFVRIHPNICLITNAYPDHVEFYGNFEILLDRFRQLLFIEPIYKPNINYKVLCLDDPNLCMIYNKLLTESKEIEKNKKYNDSNSTSSLETEIIKLKPKDNVAEYKSHNCYFETHKNQSPMMVTYGIYSLADVKAVNINYYKTYTEFDVVINSIHLISTIIPKLKTYLTGQHNVLNILGCIASSLVFMEKILCDISNEIAVSIIKDSILNFQGIKRRFNELGSLEYISIIEDYAHNPAKIKATINGAKQRFDQIFLVLEIHKYSRLFDSFDEFISVLSDVDFISLTPIHTAGQSQIEDFDCNKIRNKLNQVRINYDLSPCDQIYTFSMEGAQELLCQLEKFDKIFDVNMDYTKESSINSNHSNKDFQTSKIFDYRNKPNCKIIEEINSAQNKAHLSTDQMFQTLNSHANSILISNNKSTELKSYKSKAIIFMGAGSGITKLTDNFLSILSNNNHFAQILKINK